MPAHDSIRREVSQRPVRMEVPLRPSAFLPRQILTIAGSIPGAGMFVWFNCIGITDTKALIVEKAVEAKVRAQPKVVLRTSSSNLRSRSSLCQGAPSSSMKMQCHRMCAHPSPQPHPSSWKRQSSASLTCSWRRGSASASNNDAPHIRANNSENERIFFEMRAKNYQREHVTKDCPPQK